MSKKRRQHSAQFKAQGGLEALKGIEPIYANAAKHSVNPVQVSRLINVCLVSRQPVPIHTRKNHTLHTENAGN